MNAESEPNQVVVAPQRKMPNWILIALAVVAGVGIYYMMNRNTPQSNLANLAQL